MIFPMRRFLSLGLFAIAALAAGVARGQGAVQEFSGSGATTTAMFTVGDRWEVRWNARQAISVAAMSANGTIVAGASGVLRGSLFIPAGGQYYLKITDGTVAPAAPVAHAPPAANTNAAPSAMTNAPPAASTNAPPAPTTNAAPGAGAIPAPAMIVPDVDTPAAPVVSWHVQVMQLPQTVASTDTLTVFTPYFTMPDAVVAPFTPPPAPPAPTLTPDQLRAMVAIKGDNAQGSGFLLRTSDGVFVACHLHLLANNPNIQITSSSGEAIKILSAKAATDRDLVLIAVQDDHFSCLSIPAKDDAPVPGDPVLIPAVGESDALGGKAGKIVDFGAGRVDFDDGIDANSIGGPLIHVKSGEALAIVTAEKKIDLSENIAKAWAGNPAPGSAAIIPFFGVTLKDVAGWEALDLGRFSTESGFLQDFHDTTRCLDSYLNGRRRRPYNPQGPDGAPDSQYYAKNAQIAAAADTYRKFASGADRDQGLDASRELLFDLQAVAESDVDRLQSSNPAYAFDRQRVQEELAYRKAIKDELEALSDNIGHLNNIAGSR